MAAYGLYTHIAANKTRSMILLAGLFVLVYVVVFAVALVIEAMSTALEMIPVPETGDLRPHWCSPSTVEQKLVADIYLSREPGDVHDQAGDRDDLAADGNRWDAPQHGPACVYLFC